MPAPLLVALILLAALAVAGCGHGKRRVLESTAREALSSELLQAVPNWMVAERLPMGALPGARLFAQSGCLSCHTYLGSGSRNLGAPDLSAAGQRHGVRFFERYVAHPDRFGDNVMPSFAALGTQRLSDIGVFLAESKGRR